MSQSTISIRVDSSIKEKFDNLCNAFGLTTTSAFYIFMKAVIRERRIPFEIRAENEVQLRNDALTAFNESRTAAAENGLTGLTLEDINTEIKSIRDERR